MGPRSVFNKASQVRSSAQATISCMSQELPCLILTAQLKCQLLISDEETEPEGPELIFPKRHRVPQTAKRSN